MREPVRRQRGIGAWPIDGWPSVEKDVRRLLDPKYRGSQVERLHAALAACGVAAQITLVQSSRRERLLGVAPGRGRRAIKRAARPTCRTG